MMTYKAKLLVGVSILMQIGAVLGTENVEERGNLEGSTERQLATLRANIDQLLYKAPETPKEIEKKGNLLKVMEHQQDVIKTILEHIEAGTEMTLDFGPFVESLKKSSNSESEYDYEHLIKSSISDINKSLHASSSSSAEAGSRGARFLMFGGSEGHSRSTSSHTVANSEHSHSQNHYDQKKIAEKQKAEDHYEFYTELSGFKLHIKRLHPPASMPPSEEVKIGFNKEHYEIPNMTPEEQFLIALHNSINQK